jgi:hypothetical protein
MNKQTFELNELVRDAVIRNIEIVGEASYNICKHHPEFASAHLKSFATNEPKGRMARSMPKRPSLSQPSRNKPSPYTAQ